MTVELRDYQQDLLNRIDARFDNGARAVIGCSPTGSGKTVVGAQWAAAHAAAGRVAVWCAHTELLRKQALEAFRLIGVEAVDWTGSSAQSREWRPGVVHMVGASMTLPDIAAGAVLVVDEAHRAAAPRTAELIRHDAWLAVLGLSATPARYGWPERVTESQRTLADLFDAVEVGPDTLTLVREQHLADVILRSPSAGGDDSVLRADSMRQSGYTAESEREWEGTLSLDIAVPRTLASGQRRTIWFCASAEGAHRLLGLLPSGRLILADTPETERAAAIEAFEAGTVQHLATVGVLLEGVDVPSCSRIVLLRPSRSRVLLSQAVGRGTRPPGDCEVWDWAGSFRKLNTHPLDSLPWTEALSCEPVDMERRSRMSAAGAWCSTCETGLSAASRHRLCPVCSRELVRLCVGCQQRLTANNEDGAHRRCVQCADTEREAHVRWCEANDSVPVTDTDRRFDDVLSDRHDTAAAEIADLHDKLLTARTQASEAHAATSEARSLAISAVEKLENALAQQNSLRAENADLRARLDSLASDLKRLRDTEPDSEPSDDGSGPLDGCTIMPPLAADGQRVWVWGRKHDAGRRRGELRTLHASSRKGDRAMHGARCVAVTPKGWSLWTHQSAADLLGRAAADGTLECDGDARTDWLVEALAAEFGRSQAV